ncbi:MAG TPA: putative metal-binding motif-containing protein, partial [bacterium]|nr:putative metal-binding motif-containing protein [bacterium]
MSFAAEAFAQGNERCAPGFSFDETKRECVACDSPCETAQPGICRRGLVDCSGGAPVCRSAFRPGERIEVCNGEDDNCDGRIDEGFDKDGDGYTTCGGDCDDRNPNVHPDAVERCNGRDDNCNGLVDEGFNVGAACTAGLGECMQEGRRRCSADGLSSECDAKPGLPLKEVCDGKDNDCDGAVDDGLGEISCGVGACRRSFPTCMSGSQARCEPGEPGPELCGDGLDNDCDGKIDEGFQDVGQTCYSGVGACRRAGKIVCDATKLSTECDAVAGEPGVEMCGNRIDDDCDGEIDTDTPGIGDRCSNGMPGQCRKEGTLVCDAVKNRLTCSAPEGKPGREICDGIDNDCDGAVDNGVVERIGCGQGACAGGKRERRCSVGQWGEWSECSTAGRASPEICGDG